MALSAAPRGTCLAILLLAAIVLGSTSLAYRETALDMSTSIYIGRTILQGGVPYRDAWELRAPGIFFAFALEQLFLGKSVVGVRVFDILWQLLTALTLALISRRVWGTQVAGCLAGLLYLLLYFSQNFWSWAEPDGLLSLPLALAFLLMLKARESDRFLYWSMCGALVGIAALFKLPYGLFGIGLLFAAAQRSFPLGKTVFKWLALAIGLGVPFGFCGLYFYLKGGLHDLLTTQFVFAPYYVARVHAVTTVHDLRESALRPYLLPLYVLAAIGVGRWAPRLVFRRRVNLAEDLLVFWLAVGVLTFFMHGSYLGYHYLPFIAPLVLLAAPHLHGLYSLFRRKRRVVQAALIVAAAIFLFIPFKRLGEHAVYAWRILTQPAPHAPLRELAQFIRQNTSPDDTIFVWGNVPMIYLRADRRAASRFLCTAYLSLAAPEPDYRSILLQELERHQPIFFVLIKHGSVTPGLPDALDSYRQFEALGRWVEARYAVEKDVSQYILYHRKGGGVAGRPDDSVSFSPVRR